MDADLWGCPSFTELAREGMAAARENLLRPGGEREALHVEQLPRRDAAAR